MNPVTGTGRTSVDIGGDTNLELVDKFWDRSRWRKQIGMIDDHDECEWVNVSSGTGSPGLSQTPSREP